MPGYMAKPNGANSKTRKARLERHANRSACCRGCCFQALRPDPSPIPWLGHSCAWHSTKGCSTPDRALICSPYAMLSVLQGAARFGSHILRPLVSGIAFHVVTLAPCRCASGVCSHASCLPRHKRHAHSIPHQCRPAGAQDGPRRRACNTKPTLPLSSTEERKPAQCSMTVSSKTGHASEIPPLGFFDKFGGASVVIAVARGAALLLCATQDIAGLCFPLAAVADAAGAQLRHTAVVGPQ